MNDITMQYRFTETHLLIYLSPINTRGIYKKGYISAHKLLGRPFKNLAEFIVNSSIYECESAEHFLDFDPSKNQSLHGEGIAFPENGLVKMLEVANQHQSVGK